MSKAPAFQFYANDFMDATRFWEANAVGLYVRCLCIQWTQGAIPSDLKVLARGLGCELVELQSVWPTLAPKFVDAGGGMLQNQRLERVRERQEEISNKRSNAANERWSKLANASANLDAKNKQRKVKVKEKEKVEDEEEGEANQQRAHEVSIFPDFDKDWWPMYSKGSRKLSKAEWDKLSQKDREACFDATPAYLTSKPEKQFRKDGERFLKHRTWEDPITNTTSAASPKNQTDEQYRNEVARIFRERQAERDRVEAAKSAAGV